MVLPGKMTAEVKRRIALETPTAPSGVRAVTNESRKATRFSAPTPVYHVPESRWPSVGRPPLPAQFHHELIPLVRCHIASSQIQRDCTDPTPSGGRPEIHSRCEASPYRLQIQSRTTHKARPKKIPSTLHQEDAPPLPAPLARRGDRENQIYLP